MAMNKSPVLEDFKAGANDSAAMASDGATGANSGAERRPTEGHAAARMPATAPANEKDDAAATAAATPAQTSDASEPPDGGLESWLAVAAGCFIFMNSWGIATSFGAFQSFYQDSLFAGTSPSTISWIGSVQSTLVTATGLVTGPLTDRGHIRAIMLTGHFLVVFGLVMTSISSQYWQVLLAQGFCVGLGAGSINVPALTLVASRFTKRRQVAISFVSVGSSFGGVIFPIMFRRLQPAIGFGWAVRAMALVSLVFSAAACAILCRRPGVAKAGARATIDVRAFGEPSFALYAVGMFIAFLAYFFPLFYITSYAMAKLGADADYAFYLTSITNGSSFFGRLMPVWLRLAGLELAPLSMLHAWFAVEVLLLFTWIAVRSLSGFTVWCVAWGVLTGAIVTNTAPSVAHPTITPSLDRLGGRMGMVWACTSVGTLIGAPIAGAIADVARAEFLHAQLFAGAITIGGVLMLAYPVLTARRYDRQQKLEKTSASAGSA